MRAKLTILLCGATGSGKTTMSKTLIAAIDPTERLITIEDTLELVIPQPNHVRLLYSKDGMSGSPVAAEALLQASLRMRPDRVLVQELRDDAACTYINEVVSGHPGSITTIHGNGAPQAFRRLFSLAKSSAGCRVERRHADRADRHSHGRDHSVRGERRGLRHRFGLVCGGRRPARRDRGRPPARDMIPIPPAAWIVAGAGLYLATFTVLATLFFLVGTGLIGAFAHPFWQWWLYALWYSGNPVVRAWLEVSGVPAAALPLAVAGSI